MGCGWDVCLLLSERAPPPWTVPISAEPFIPTRPPQAMEQQPFVDRHWLYYNPLRRDTVLTYFAQSRFYDRASCNEELRMQGATVRACTWLSPPAADA